MARLPRALIIACENYLRGEDVAPQLPGTLTAAQGFYDWLVKSKLVGTNEIYLCCDDPIVPAHPANRTYKANRADILTAIADLVDQGRDETSELYVYFSGHGVGWEVAPQQRGLDVLLASDYRKRQISGGCCIKVDELRGDLRNCLGGEDHYYFLDACRNVMKIGEIQPADLGLALNLASSGEPTTYVLYSTRFGEAAKVNSGFAGALLQGLNGAGRAKQKTKGNWWVRFDRLQKYVQAHVKGKTDLSKDGDRDGLILQVQTVQPSPCTVTIDNASATDQFALTVQINEMPMQFSITGASFEKSLMPTDDGYEFDLKFNGRSLPRLAPPPGEFIDLFEPVELRYTTTILESVREEAPRPPAGLEVRGIAHPDITVRIRNRNTGQTATDAFRVPDGGVEWVPLSPGPWIAETLQDGNPVRSEEFTLEPGERRPLDPLREPESRVQQSIIASLPRSLGLPDASETLQGPIAEQDTALWLCILGASRLIDNPRNFSKLGPLPLATFDDLQKGDSVVYVLAGLEANSIAQVGVGESADVKWQPLNPVDRLEGVQHVRMKLSPGPHLISLALPGIPPVTYATYALPNRAALMVFDVKSSGQIDVRQMLLPVYSLFQYLDWQVRERLEIESLRLVKYLTLAQERFANRHSLAPATPVEQEHWDSMLSGKWIDALFAIMAIFEAARRGKTQEMAEPMGEAIANLNRFFGDLPDVAAVSKLLGHPSGPTKGAPLLLESLQRVPDFKASLPLSPDFLDYNSMWTSWFGAVKPPAGMA